jgi:uncharacterized protein YndB with AHSA1/START domain
MEKLKYQIEIARDRETVWKMITELDSYKRWASAFSANSQFVGSWEEGKYIDFVDPAFGGTRALLEEVVQPERIRARHTATVSAEGNPDTESDAAKKWIGSREEYTLRETEDGTLLVVDMYCHQDFVGMFDEAWAKALPLLKSLCEQANS